MRVARHISALPTVWTNVIAAFVLAGAAIDPRVLLPLIVGCSLVHLGARTLVGVRVASDASGAATVLAYEVWRKKLSPAVSTLARVFVYVATALIVAGSVSRPVLIGALCAGAYLASVAWNERSEGASASLVLLFVPLVATIALVRDPAGVVIWLGFLAWTIRQVAAIADGRRATEGLVAGVALLDATLIAHAGRPFLAAMTTTAFALTLALQRFAREAR